MIKWKLPTAARIKNSELGDDTRRKKNQKRYFSRYKYRRRLLIAAHFNSDCRSARLDFLGFLRIFEEESWVSEEVFVRWPSELWSNCELAIVSSAKQAKLIKVMITRNYAFKVGLLARKVRLEEKKKCKWDRIRSRDVAMHHQKPFDCEKTYMTNRFIATVKRFFFCFCTRHAFTEC